MIAVIQRVRQSSVSVDGVKIGQIGAGMLTLLGVSESDEPADADFLAQKLVHLRIFEDESGKMNRSIREIGGGMLVVSQFTLLGDCRKGRRPSFVRAARPEHAIPLYERFVEQVRLAGVSVETGRFGAMMDVSLINDGPVTLIVESRP
jgi:D-tyrosyl-tRNA(Tyr) deacylase